MERLVTEKLAALRAQRDATIRRVHALSEAELKRPLEWNGIPRTVQFLIRQFGNHELDHLVHAEKILRKLGRERSEAELLLQRVQALHGEFEALVLALSDAELTARPGGDWSIAELIDHLIAAERQNLERIEQALAGG